MATAPPNAKVDAGRVIGHAFEALKALFLPSFAIALLLAGLPAFLTQYLALAMDLDVQEPGLLPLENWELALASWLGLIVGSALLQGVLVRSTILQLSGRAPDIGGSALVALRLLLPLLGISICVAIGVGVGLICLIVPGIMIACACYIAVPALVEERRGVFGSIERSRELTRGSRPQIFLLLVFNGILSMVASAIAAMISGAAFATSGRAASPDPLISGAANGAAAALTALVSTIIVAALYVELREVREGTSTHELAEVFA